MRSLALPEGDLRALLGIADEHARIIEEAFGVALAVREGAVLVVGDDLRAEAARRFLAELAAVVASGHRLQPVDVRAAARLALERPESSIAEFFLDSGLGAEIRRVVSPRTPRQHDYVRAIASHDLVFAIGPAGTGKTYLAVAMAATALVEKRIRRVVLCRPAVEAGERLGFLPGDLAEKVNPYLRPLYDALFDILGTERVEKALERGVIEVAPIAFMRGRTLNEAFVILDEAQNTTSEQMKMFLTRIGNRSRAVVTGDVTQTDLPQGKESGLREAVRILSGTEGIAFHYFDQSDVVRHPLVQAIVNAYERADKQRAGGVE